jgi:hypothetical protein
MFGKVSPDLRRLLAVWRTGASLDLVFDDTRESSVSASASDRFPPARHGNVPVDMPAARTGPDFKAIIAPMRT